ncbi:hypothetical protein MHK_008697 [Candidatus Magnetomorum sp. HK-1]|nr:hypothetical protein MHK_008697 [Candidatus Magnetomorum sp. HK-1]
MIVYTDMHIFGAHPKIHEPLTFGPDTFYIGDIVDLKNCPKSQIPEARKLIEHIEKNAGDNYLPGNHELSYGNKPFIKYNRVLLTHGDMFFWPQKKIVHWRGGGIKAGMSLPLWLTFRLKNYFRELLPKNICPEAYKRIYETATAPAHKCHTVIIGHEHPSQILKKTYAQNNGPPIDLYILPRGRHVLDIQIN